MIKRSVGVQKWLEKVSSGGDSRAPGFTGLRIWRVDDNKACMAIFSIPSEDPDGAEVAYVAQGEAGRVYIPPSELEEHVKAGEDIQVLYLIPVFVWKAGWQVFAKPLGNERSLLSRILSMLHLLRDTETPLYIARKGKDRNTTTYDIVPASTSPLAQYVDEFVAQYEAALSERPSGEEMLQVVKRVMRGRVEK